MEAIVEGWVVMAGREEKMLWETFREVVGWISCWIDRTDGDITSSVLEASSIISASLSSARSPAVAG